MEEKCGQTWRKKSAGNNLINSEYVGGVQWSSSLKEKVSLPAGRGRMGVDSVSCKSKSRRRQRYETRDKRTKDIREGEDKERDGAAVKQAGC